MDKIDKDDFLNPIDFCFEPVNCNNEKLSFFNAPALNTIENC